MRHWRVWNDYGETIGDPAVTTGFLRFGDWAVLQEPLPPGPNGARKIPTERPRTSISPNSPQYARTADAPPWMATDREGALIWVNASGILGDVDF